MNNESKSHNNNSNNMDLNSIVQPLLMASLEMGKLTYQHAYKQTYIQT